MAALPQASADAMSVVLHNPWQPRFSLQVWQPPANADAGVRQIKPWCCVWLTITCELLLQSTTEGQGVWHLQAHAPVVRWASSGVQLSRIICHQATVARGRLCTFCHCARMPAAYYNTNRCHHCHSRHTRTQYVCHGIVGREHANDLFG